MFILFNKTIFELDDLVNQYLIYLTHIQQSVNLKVSEKIGAFNSAETIANDINALTTKLLAMQVNTFNQDDIFKFIDKSFSSVIRGIKSEITFYDKKLSINDKMLFSVKDAINLLVNDKTYDLNLSNDKINRFLSYQKLFIDEDEKIKAERHRIALEEAKTKENKAFQDIKFKTFKELIRSVNHNNEDYFFKTNIYVITNFIDSFEFELLEKANRIGCFFIIEKDIHLLINKDNLHIDYTIKIDTSGSSTRIFILGYIKHDGSKVDFYIDETFDTSFLNSYLNAFNITPILKKWNECYLKYFAKEESGMMDDINAKKHIDNFFDGKIS